MTWSLNKNHKAGSNSAYIGNPPISRGISKTKIRPTLLCRGIGYNAAKHLEENQPYQNLKELAEKTDTSIIDSRVVYALAENGYFGNKKGKKTVEKISNEFIQIRNDLKLAAKKGVESVDIFE
ncbi:hypothetical protein LCGC14_1212560 [marine sediment metagenome]|uniref:Uncharacterized protein n=1 Tax=marine sediment metagenome TaxID=412755 RepID=A0A0F9PI74_9ZZZZ